jgi:hypothetical protein
MAFWDALQGVLTTDYSAGLKVEDALQFSGRTAVLGRAAEHGRTPAHGRTAVRGRAAKHGRTAVRPYDRVTMMSLMPT